MNLFKDTKPDRAAAQVEKHRRILAMTETELRSAEDLYRAVLNASVDGEDGDHGPKILAALSERDKAKEKLMIAQAMTSAAENVHSRAVEDAKAKQVAAEWRRCEEMAERRRELAEKVTKNVTTLIENVDELSKLGIDLYNAAPISPGSLTPSDPLSPFQIEQFVQLEMARQGWLWAKPGILMLDHDKVPTFVKQTGEGNWWAFSKRASEKSRDATHEN